MIILYFKFRYSRRRLRPNLRSENKISVTYRIAGEIDIEGLIFVQFHTDLLIVPSLRTFFCVLCGF
jgi:hypothetical protein